MISDADGTAFVLDCLVSDTHSWTADATSYPVESGARISDHIQNEPLEVTIEAIVSNAPIGVIRTEREKNPKYQPDESTDALMAHLMKIRDDRKPVTIRTSLRTYENMALLNLDIPRDASTGDAIRFSATFRQIKIVKNIRGPRVQLPAAVKPVRTRNAPKPAGKAAAGQTSSFNETLPLVKVFRLDGQYLWYDDTLNGWRYEATYDAPIGGRPSSEGWVVIRGQPYGVTSEEWYSNRKTDAEYRRDIAIAYEARSELNGGGGGLGLNKYDPFINFGIDDRGLNIQIVHAMVR